jgi:regulation of enolase protein 1 (concanavalin A-like superfamily)
VQWYNEPPVWEVNAERITVITGAKTDFWRKTHAGFIKDDGHFYAQPVSGDFTAEVKVSGKYRDLYDHAGLMLRLDAEHWLKCGIEFVEGVQYASTVVTHDYSDWSVVTLSSPPAIWLRLKRHHETVEISYSLDGQQFTMMRQAYFPPAEGAQVGIMCCAPQGNGLEVTFEGFVVHQDSG